MAHDRDDLDMFFDAAKGAEHPSADLVARVLAGADQVQRSGALKAPEPAAPWRWLAVLGGWQGVGGLVAAGCAGLAIGLASPAAIDTVLGGQLSDLGFVESEDLIPGLEAMLAWDEG